MAGVGQVAEMSDLAKTAISLTPSRLAFQQSRTAAAGLEVEPIHSMQRQMCYAAAWHLKAALVAWQHKS